MDLPQEREDEGDVEFDKDWPVVGDGDIGDGEVASIARYAFLRRPRRVSHDVPRILIEV
jgi:hypothetical protein